ncbi:MAG: hypothetical protein A2808_03745 [Candidatus Moranbacteria bacterium RIFCSPHIGHO2_01_FULL_55_24]|nr:MAG: hypothetical protein A2808_03745 [Candidatus Moranbacteria bacterium RIFCSPHIGHO2_01_FULL_55_24]
MRFIFKIIPQPVKNLGHLGLALLANIRYGFPGRKLSVIGVTGTNGKTTTAQMIARILERVGYKTAFATTVNFCIGDREWVNASKFTTLSSWKLQKFLAEAHRAGVTHVVLETSSHALDQHRVFGVPYLIAVITNVTREHLDYHKTLPRYRQAKARLFKQAKHAVINADMEHPEEFQGLVSGKTVLYSTKEETADIVAEGISLDFHAIEFRVGEIHFRLPLPGLFNIENALAALGAASLLGIDFSSAREALAEMRGVPGRMELVPNAEGIDIIIDYAVTPDAFEKLYASVLPLKIPGTKIIHVFGTCGDRDRGKRPILGDIASRNADVVILTNEDPYTEDPERIIDEVEKGVTKKKDKEYFRIFDRREAIRKALSLAERGDIVLITGKGAETSMAWADRREPWSERQTIEETLKELKK